MALKLQVPWSQAHLPVGYEEVTHLISQRAPVSPNVEVIAGGDVLVKDFFGVNNRVPDVSRYRIKQNDCCVPHDGRYRIWHDKYLIPHGNLTGQDISRYDISGEALQQQLAARQDIRNIVLLLESPHKDEYIDGDITRPKAPARGDSGKNIDRCLATVLLHIQEIEPALIEPGCHVVISNPIQFQTSLHAIHGGPPRADNGKWGTLRNNVWRKLWNEPDIRQCFGTRLGCYYPKVIINACTSDLKPLVRTFVRGWITEGNLEVPLYELAHPSNWENLRPNPA